jgi:hypothetical protein
MDLGRWHGRRFGSAYLLQNNDVAIDTEARPRHARVTDSP